MDGLVQTDGAMFGLYDRDFAAWALDQAARLRRASLDNPTGLDWENLAEEIEALARSDRRALHAHIRTIAGHLMKLEASPAIDPHAGWRQTILQARWELEVILGESPSLRGSVAEAVARELPAARKLVTALLADFGETLRVPIASLTYTPEQITSDWWPA
jgi:hypothetical protein